MVAVAKKTEVRLYPRLLVVRMLKASFKVRLWPISNGNAVMTYVGFRSKISSYSIQLYYLAQMHKFMDCTELNKSLASETNLRLCW